MERYLTTKRYNESKAVTARWGRHSNMAYGFADGEDLGLRQSKCEGIDCELQNGKRVGIRSCVKHLQRKSGGGRSAARLELAESEQHEGVKGSERSDGEQAVLAASRAEHVGRDVGPKGRRAVIGIRRGSNQRLSDRWRVGRLGHEPSERAAPPGVVQQQTCNRVDSAPAV